MSKYYSAREKKELLIEIVRKRQPALVEVVEAGLKRGFSPDYVRPIEELVGDELIEHGITDGEVNDYGIVVDDIIGMIGPLP